MIKVAVCDDSHIVIKQLEKYFNTYAAKNHNLEVSFFKLSTELLNNIDNGERYDIYILDVVMPSINGIELGNIIRKLDDSCYIIYISASSDFALESFGVFAYQYLVKPLDYNIFNRVMDKTLANFEENERKGTSVKTKDGNIFISHDELMYAEYSAHKIYFHMRNGETIPSNTLRIPFLSAMSDFLNNESFVQCHISYMVNLKLVKEIRNNSLILKNNAVVPISRKFYKAVKSRLK